MEPIDEINQTHPCDRRGGYATKGCDCDGTKTLDKARVKCLFYGRAAKYIECRGCPHQKAYIRMLENQKKNV
jgi:hypothetical protein